MSKDEAVTLIWDYMHLGHELKKADLVLVLGSNDVRVAHHAAKLWHDGWAPYISVSGDGRNHESSLLRNSHNGQTEAAAFKDVLTRDGVPEDRLILEQTANNSGENFMYTKPLLDAQGIKTDIVIVVQKPYMERRAFATGRVHWPKTEFILTSPTGTFDEYIAGYFDPDQIIHTMVGDLERIATYPKLGYQIPQNIPEAVQHAFSYLVEHGYTERLLKQME